MRILLVSSGYAPQIGGVERHVEGLARAFTELGHEIEVVAPAAIGESGGHKEIDGIQINSHRSLGVGAALQVAPLLWPYLRRRASHYDVMHVHNFHALPALAAASARPRLLAFTPHYHGIGHSRLLQMLHTPYRPAARLVFARSHAVICVTAQEAARVAADFPTAAPRISVIPNGVDLPVPDGPDTHAVHEHGRMLLSVARLEAHKNVAALVAALPSLPDDFTLSIVGEGSEGADLRDQTRRLGLTQRVRFLGRVSDGELEQAYAHATVVACVSRMEAYGLVLAEALARGCRVLASDIPAHRDVVETSGARGVEFVALNTTPTQLARAIMAAAHRPTPVRRPDFMSWATVAEATLAVYADAGRRLSRGH